MSRILSPVLRKGFPFPVTVGGETWDGTTFEEIGGVDLDGDDLPLFAPAPDKVGAGTLYPIGMARDTVMKILYRVRTWDFHLDFDYDGTPSDYDVTYTTGAKTVFEVGANAEEKEGLVTLGNQQGISAYYADEIDLPIRAFIAIMLSGNDPTGQYFHDFCAEGQTWPNGTDYFRGNTVTNRDGFWNRNRVARTGSLFYPMILHGGIFDGGEFGTQAYMAHGEILRGGDPETNRGGNADLALNEATCVFTGTGLYTTGDPGSSTGFPTCSYEFTLTPASYWTYGGMYDSVTGLPV